MPAGVPKNARVVARVLLDDGALGTHGNVGRGGSGEDLAVLVLGRRGLDERGDLRAADQGRHEDREAHHDAGLRVGERQAPCGQPGDDERRDLRQEDGLLEEPLLECLHGVVSFVGVSAVPSSATTALAYAEGSGTPIDFAAVVAA